MREALANALIHADYYDRRGLVVQKWPDRIRITNPGAFRINVQEALVGGVSDLRNESLIKMFNLINVVERAGSGLPSIRAVWQKQHWETPEIAESFGPDRTTLLLPLVSEKAAIKGGDTRSGRITEQRKAEILQYLTDTPQATSTEIAQAIERQGFARVVVPRFTHFALPLTTEKATYGKICEALIQDTLRNDLIVQDARDLLAQGRTTDDSPVAAFPAQGREGANLPAGTCAVPGRHPAQNHRQCHRFAVGGYPGYVLPKSPA